MLCVEPSEDFVTRVDSLESERCSDMLFSILEKNTICFFNGIVLGGS